MISGVGFHPDAKREMREAADFYDLERLGLGAEFLDAVEGTMRRVIEYPESSPVVLGQVRRCSVTRFPLQAPLTAGLLQTEEPEAGAEALPRDGDGKP